MAYLYEIIIAVLKQAKRDYIDALRKKDFYKINELETFFLSDYGQAMSRNQGEKIIDLCKRIARKNKEVQKLTYNGETHTVGEWAKIKGLTPQLLRERLKHGYSIGKALNTPPKWKKSYKDKIKGVKNEISNRNNGIPKKGD